MRGDENETRRRMRTKKEKKKKEREEGKRSGKSVCPFSLPFTCYEVEYAH
jgi:hypothetical protein